MQPARGHAMPFGAREATPGARLCGFLALSLAPIALVVAAIATAGLDLHGVVREGHRLLEGAQLGAWILAAAVAALGCWRQRTRRGLLLLWWVAALSLLAGLRELDLQVLVNADNIHLLGLDARWAIRWKAAWLFDSQVPLGVRAAWMLILAGIGTMVVLPYGLAGYPWPVQLRRRDPFPWLLVAAFGVLAASFLFEDLVGRPLAARGFKLSTIEESLEMLGAAGVLAWVAWLASGEANLHPDA